MLERAWYRSSAWLVFLRPLSVLFGYLSRRRRQRLEARASGPDVPILIVGNINVGGSGKTPIIIELIRLSRQLGYRPGVISRGYGGQADAYPLIVTSDTEVAQSGDEPLLIAKRTGVPVVVDPDRVAAAEKLSGDFEVDLILSDDGLQHYRLKRDAEIAVIDGVRGLGNGRLLPEGPLRESKDRLRSVDLVLVNGGDSGVWPGALGFELKARHFKNLSTGHEVEPTPDALGSTEVWAIAGIGHPERFFAQLRALGFKVTSRALADHAPITIEDLEFGHGKTLVMTEKDAVKCGQAVAKHLWSLQVGAQFKPEDELRLNALIEHLCSNKIGEKHGSQVAGHSGLPCK